MADEQGYVQVKDRWVHAARVPSGNIVRFPKEGPGVVCSKKIAGTFLEADWNVTPERMRGVIRWAEDLERLFRPMTGQWRMDGLYSCLVCGAGAISDRNIHLRYHRGDYLYDVLWKLFGRPY